MLPEVHTQHSQGSEILPPRDSPPPNFPRSASTQHLSSPGSPGPGDSCQTVLAAQERPPGPLASGEGAAASLPWLPKRLVRSGTPQTRDRATHGRGSSWRNSPARSQPAQAHASGTQLRSGAGRPGEGGDPGGWHPFVSQVGEEHFSLTLTPLH